MSVHAAPVTSSTIVVAVDVGKTSAMLSATDSARQRLLGPVEFAMTRSGLVGGRASGGRGGARRVRRSRSVSKRLGIITGRCWIIGGRPGGRCWSSIRPMSPSSAGSQGRRRVKTDAIDLEAITELVLAGRGQLITDREVRIGELAAWATTGRGGSPPAPRPRISCSVNSTARFRG